MGKQVPAKGGESEAKARRERKHFEEVGDATGNGMSVGGSSGRGGQ